MSNPSAAYEDTKLNCVNAIEFRRWEAILVGRTHANVGWRIAHPGDPRLSVSFPTSYRSGHQRVFL
jgi:hypothetical protein